MILAELKEKFKLNKGNIFIFLIIFLVILLLFGIGELVVFRHSNPVLQIQMGE